MGSRGRQPERKKANAAVIGGVVAVVVLGAGVSAYALFSGDSDRTTAADDKPRIKTGPVTAAEVRTAADRFLTAWAAGDTAKAAAATDDATAATAALTSYGKDAHLSGVKLTPGKRAGAKMPFAVSATVAYGGKSKPFAYGSELTVVRRVKDGKPLVGWQASVVHPDLKDGDRLVTGAAGDPPIKATDRSGNELTAAEYPSLGTVIDGLREKYGKKAGGTAGIELRVVHKDSGKESEHTPDKTLVTLSKGTPGTLRTTISPTSQAVAERQVAKREKAAVVVIKPSTGEILAVANSRPEGFNTALQGSSRPAPR